MIGQSDIDTQKIIVELAFPMLLIVVSMTIGAFCYGKLKIKAIAAFGIPLFIAGLMISAVSIFELQSLITSVMEPLILAVGMPVLGLFMVAPLLLFLFRRKSTN